MRRGFAGTETLATSSTNWAHAPDNTSHLSRQSCRPQKSQTSIPHLWLIATRKPNQLRPVASFYRESAIKVNGVGTFTHRPYCPQNKFIQRQYPYPHVSYQRIVVQQFPVCLCRGPEVVKRSFAHTCTLQIHPRGGKAAVNIWRQMEKRQGDASLTSIEAGINLLIGR